ncbi:regulator of chromosome condensation 1/beta-lactamase-inhibitor protein II [Dimargaris cristalligena]|uniref:Regulator of chromosome condensation 1/beta-lactamase-inhibitor protein II n=1 Tax=Dimargaris cristalligena TaxID=215637 RepID=A0A4P9ZWK8_9FUNG|nr:regulator of chromosome condensation 1/beta-lactamase-inhibitor protein II [Dimargaris cristalligena]|eukprot:RKP37993.1 regulator of chromosome condensation 1/beta-lactamase-inhibitor protein II [Dimargaris cristalligena]
MLSIPFRYGLLRGPQPRLRWPSRFPAVRSRLLSTTRWPQHLPDTQSSNETSPQLAEADNNCPHTWNWQHQRQHLAWARGAAAERANRRPWQFWVSRKPDALEEAWSWANNPPLHPLIHFQAEPATIEQMSCGLAHAATLVDGQIWLWGSNSHGQVGPIKATSSWGTEDDEDVVVPYAMTELHGHRIRSIASGSFHNLALTDQGQVWTWGAGVLGRGDEVYDSYPFPIHYFDEIQRPVVGIGAAGEYSLAVTRGQDEKADDATVPHEMYLWGYPPSSPPEQRAAYKALSPALIHALMGSRIHQVHCAPHHFSVLHSLAHDPHRYLLSVFGALDPVPLAQRDTATAYEAIAGYPTYLDLPLTTGVFNDQPALVRHLADLPVDPATVVQMCGGWNMQLFRTNEDRLFLLDHDTFQYTPIGDSSDPQQRIASVAVGSCQVVVLLRNGALLSWHNLEAPERLGHQMRTTAPTLLQQNPSWTRVVAHSDQFIVY